MSERQLPLPIPADHPTYAGHFPGQPILPGVVLLDAALHALAAQVGRPATTGQLRSAKFLNPVRPGEALTLHYTETPGAGFRFEIRSVERPVASGSVTFAETSLA